MDKTYGKPPFPFLKYCSRCCMPESSEKMAFDEFGICNACRASEQKMHIDWTERQKKFEELMDYYKGKAKNTYNCMVPISGGKDSIFQLHVLKKVYGMNPLAVTFSHNWFTEIGKENLMTCLEKIDVDHIMYTPKRSLINRLAKQSLYAIGDACWHCHMGVDSVPLQVAVKWQIPLMIYGEPQSEFSGKTTYKDEPKFEYDHYAKKAARKSVEEMIGDNIDLNEMTPFRSPSFEELEKLGVMRIFLGDYFFWDHERQTEFMVNEYGWKEDKVDGTYKRYKSVECKMTGLHDYMKYVKRGFGRGTDFASQDVRAGLITREEGFDLAKKYDAKRPKVLEYYLKITGLKEEEFLKVLKEHRQGDAQQLPDIKRAGDID